MWFDRQPQVHFAFFFDSRFFWARLGIYATVLCGRWSLGGEKGGGHVSDCQIPTFIVYYSPVACVPLPVLQHCRCTSRSSRRLRANHVCLFVLARDPGAPKPNQTKSDQSRQIDSATSKQNPRISGQSLPHISRSLDFVISKSRGWHGRIGVLRVGGQSRLELD